MESIPAIVLNAWRAYNGRQLRKSPKGWWTGNAVCCSHNNESRDRRHRGGLIEDNNGGFTWKCFNCNFSTKYIQGNSFGPNLRKFLTWMGIPDSEISRLNLESIKSRNMLDSLEDNNNKSLQDILSAKKRFNTVKLPDNARLITTDDVKFIKYLESRGFNNTDYNFYITPDDVGRNNNRIIIPYMSKRKIVGYTSRYLDRRNPRYINEGQQPGYLFGMDFQKPNWKYLILCEGVLDSISINSVAVMHNELTSLQLATIKTSPKDVIVVPDQDVPGLTLVNQAIEAGFMVSIPDWGDNITDINSAMSYFGKTSTLLSIMNSAESNKVKITMALNKLKSRLKN